MKDRREYWKNRRIKFGEERKCKRCGARLDDDADEGRMHCWICSSNRRDDIEELTLWGIIE